MNSVFSFNNYKNIFSFLAAGFCLKNLAIARKIMVLPESGLPASLARMPMLTGLSNNTIVQILGQYLRAAKTCDSTLLSCIASIWYGVSPALFLVYSRRAFFGFRSRKSVTRLLRPRTATCSGLSPCWRKKQAAVSVGGKSSMDSIVSQSLLVGPQFSTANFPKFCGPVC